ncbi:MAG: hypothetical protein ACYTDX_09620 [Planctomycetota bacterium]
MLWDREQVLRLFDYDLKSHRRGTRLRVLFRHIETNGFEGCEAMRTAERQHADAQGLEVT